MSEAEDYLQLSGLQHFIFCRRQWALIHIEQQWADNSRTADGQIFHKTAHDAGKIEKRGDILITRGLRIKSDMLGMSGICDVVEFHRDNQGVKLFTHEGLWRPYPIEYKRGRPKEHDADEAQLCAQAMCLEEMLLCRIPEGSLYYGENHHRTRVVFTDELRKKVTDAAVEMHAMWDRGYTPRVRRTKSCNACSLMNICLPQLFKSETVARFIDDRVTAEKPEL